MHYDVVMRCDVMWCDDCDAMWCDDFDAMWCGWWLWLMTGDDDCVWWLCLMTVIDDCDWWLWLMLMTVFDDCVWWLWLSLWLIDDCVDLVWKLSLMMTVFDECVCQCLMRLVFKLWLVGLMSLIHCVWWVWLTVFEGFHWLWLIDDYHLMIL